MPQILDKVPAPVAGWLRTRFGKHLSRFVVVALISLATTQIVLSIAYLAIGTGGLATSIGWLAGALVSYLLSRRAWDRKGRPQLLRETLPFWIISGVTAVVLITAGHFAGVYAKTHNLPKLEATAVVAGTVLLANVLTFITRFLIFHYVLFADRGTARGSVGPSDAESITTAVVTVPPSDGQPGQSS